MADEFNSADKDFESRHAVVPLPHIDFEMPCEDRDVIYPKTRVALSNQQICEDTSCYTKSSIGIRVTAPEKRISNINEFTGSYEDVSGLLENTVEEWYENNHSTKEGNNTRNIDLIRHGLSRENSNQIDFLSRNISKTEDNVHIEARNECNHSQRQQIDEENRIRFPQHVEHNVNRESINQNVTSGNELDAEDSRCTRTDLGKVSYSLYPQLEEGKYCGETETGIMESQVLQMDLNGGPVKNGKYFCYDPPLHEETGSWIPVSIPPMPANEHEEWSRGICLNGGYIPEGEMGWDQLNGEDKELTMWDVVVEMLLAAQGKVSSLASADFQTISWISNHLIEQAWKEMAQTLTEANFCSAQEILYAEPPKWLPDSAASACMLCSVHFHPIMCTRHHCRFCGGIFCGDCTKGRSLLPEKFRSGNPERVCDVCCVRLESIQPYLMNQTSRAAQLPTHDLTDLSTLRSWVNFPWGQSMEYEIYKATNTIRGYAKVGSLKPERKIPEAILRNAKGLAILTVVKVGMVVTYNIGTGLVIARKEDGTWSPPSAISSFGVGWGAQGGGELTDYIVVLRSREAVQMFSGDAHVCIGAGLSAAFGIVGRTAEADVRAGFSGCAACYTYSCSKGAFVGCSLEGSVVSTRVGENTRFYGRQSIRASEIILGSLPRPPAAAALYRALGDLYQKL